jgi:hypothetical protein
LNGNDSVVHEINQDVWESQREVGVLLAWQKRFEFR